MFHRVLIRKYVGQSAVLFLACGLALFAFAWVRVWVVSLLDMGQFQTILEQFREFEKFAPIDFDALFTYPGRVGMTYDEPIVIHEHDAIYYSEDELLLEQFAKSSFDIIGLNDPRGATRLASIYDNRVQEQQLALCRAPLIDQHMVPQGIAGNSAYYIEPAGAQKMLSLVKEYGAWPNDALMCRQLVPTLGQSKKYYTYVQGLESTTSR